MASEREKAEMPNFGPTIVPEPDTSTPSTPCGKINSMKSFHGHIHIDIN